MHTHAVLVSFLSVGPLTEGLTVDVETTTGFVSFIHVASLPSLGECSSCIVQVVVVLQHSATR